MLQQIENSVLSAMDQVIIVKTIKYHGVFRLMFTVHTFLMSHLKAKWQKLQTGSLVHRKTPRLRMRIMQHAPLLDVTTIAKQMN